MSKNIEIKAKVDLGKIEQLVQKLKDVKAPQIIQQEDVFFHAERGRLKLRKFPDGNSELIFYTRPNSTGPKTSDYQIYRTNKTNELQTFLTNSFGARGIVKKERKLYMYNNTRIHLDKVDNLGEFMELEVMVINNFSMDDCQRIANELVKYFEISEEMLIDKAYIDLLEEK